MPYGFIPLRSPRMLPIIHFVFSWEKVIYTNKQSRKMNESSQLKEKMSSRKLMRPGDSAGLKN